MNQYKHGMWVDDDHLGTEIGCLQDDILKQMDFIDWLKEKGLYNPMEDAITMQKLQAVWEAATKDGRE